MPQCYWNYRKIWKPINVVCSPKVSDLVRQCISRELPCCRNGLTHSWLRNYSPYSLFFFYLFGTICFLSVLFHKVIFEKQALPDWRHWWISCSSACGFWHVGFYKERLHECMKWCNFRLKLYREELIYVPIVLFFYPL